MHAYICPLRCNDAFVSSSMAKSLLTCTTTPNIMVTTLSIKLFTKTSSLARMGGDSYLFLWRLICVKARSFCHWEEQHVFWGCLLASTIFVDIALLSFHCIIRWTMRGKRQTHYSFKQAHPVITQSIPMVWCSNLI